MIILDPRFELVSKYTDESLLPQRSTSESAGYDFFVAEDTLLPAYVSEYQYLKNRHDIESDTGYYTLNEVADITKRFKCKPTLVPTGVKAYIPKREYLQLSVRSSLPLKHWIIMANGVGIIDGDYVDNPDNEGHIYFQLINLYPFDILLKKGDKIGQGIFLPYDTIVGDKITTKRTGGFGSTSS